MTKGKFLILTGIGLTTLAVVGSVSGPASAIHGDQNPLRAIQFADPGAIDSAAAVPMRSTWKTVIDDTVAHTDIRVPLNPENGIALKSDARSISVGLPFANIANDASVEAPGIVSYDNNNGSTTVPIVKADGSIQITTVIEKESAPQQYEYLIDVPTGGRLMPMPDGAVTIIDAEGMQVAHIAQPWAKDAHGKPVPTKYEVHETTVTQVVEHADTSVTYPVVADPEVRVEWWGFAAKLSRSETRDLANLVGTKASFVAALCAFIPNPVGIAACIAGVELRIAFWMDPINQASAEGKCAQINQPHIGGILSSNVTKENC